MEDYLHKMDVKAVMSLCAVAGIPEEVKDWIWEEQVTKPKMSYRVL